MSTCNWKRGSHFNTENKRFRLSQNKLDNDVLVKFTKWF